MHPLSRLIEDAIRVLDGTNGLNGRDLTATEREALLGKIEEYRRFLSNQMPGHQRANERTILNKIAHLLGGEQQGIKPQDPLAPLHSLHQMLPTAVVAQEIHIAAVPSPEVRVAGRASRTAWEITSSSARQSSLHGEMLIRFLLSAASRPASIERGTTGSTPKLSEKLIAEINLFNKQVEDMVIALNVRRSVNIAATAESTQVAVKEEEIEYVRAPQNREGIKCVIVLNAKGEIVRVEVSGQVIPHALTRAFQALVEKQPAQTLPILLKLAKQPAIAPLVAEILEQPEAGEGRAAKLTPIQLISAITRENPVSIGTTALAARLEHIPQAIKIAETLGILAKAPQAQQPQLRGDFRVAQAVSRNVAPMKASLNRAKLVEMRQAFREIQASGLALPKNIIERFSKELNQQLQPKLAERSQAGLATANVTPRLAPRLAPLPLPQESGAASSLLAIVQVLEAQITNTFTSKVQPSPEVSRTVKAELSRYLADMGTPIKLPVLELLVGMIAARVGLAAADNVKAVYDAINRNQVVRGLLDVIKEMLNAGQHEDVSQFLCDLVLRIERGQAYTPQLVERAIQAIVSEVKGRRRQDPDLDPAEAA